MDGCRAAAPEGANDASGVEQQDLATADPALQGKPETAELVRSAARTL